MLRVSLCFSQTQRVTTKLMMMLSKARLSLPRRAARRARASPVRRIARNESPCYPVICLRAIADDYEWLVVGLNKWRRTDFLR